MTGTEARELAIRKARYGHNDWIIWKDKTTGDWHAEKETSASVKRALLAVGTQGYYMCYTASKAWSLMYKWRMGVNAFTQLKYYETHGRL